MSQLRKSEVSYRSRADMCCSCAHVTWVQEASGRYSYTCSLHNFRVKAQAVCPSYRVRPSGQTTVDSYPTLF